jgi:hypothetical protein
VVVVVVGLVGLALVVCCNNRRIAYPAWQGELMLQPWADLLCLGCIWCIVSYAMVCLFVDMLIWLF